MNYKYLTFLKYYSLIILCLVFSGNDMASAWYVGPSRMYSLPSQVKNLVQDGDTIYIDGGEYINDATKWNKKNLKIIGLGTGNNRAILKYTGDIPNGKGIFVFESPGICDNALIENLVFDGAQVSDADGGNGAAIRFQAKDITIRNCKFMNCQNGILEGHGSVTSSNVIIMNSEFYNNGYQQRDDPDYSGYEHHIYISASADTLEVINCWFHHPRGQANSLKTRAQRSFILYNLIDEEATGYGSWELNIAQGGLNIIMGNIIIQGSAGANHGIISYDAATNTLEDFYFINNTVINQFEGNNRYFNITPASGITTYKIYNNILASIPGASNTLFSGNIPFVLDTANNYMAPDYFTIGFVDPSINDYHLTSASTLSIDHGANAGFTNTGYSLTPVSMYQSFVNDLLPRPISGAAIDIGAYEYFVPSGTKESHLSSGITIYPNPNDGKFIIEMQTEPSSPLNKVSVLDINGKVILTETGIFNEPLRELDLSGLPNGIYFVTINGGNENYQVKIIVL